MRLRHIVVVLLPILCAAAPREVMIINRAAAPIVEIYLSAATDMSWGEDRLGQTPVPPGATWRVASPPAGACSIDVRVLYGDGRAEERHGVDICRTRDVTFDASAAVAPLVVGNHRVTLENHSPRIINEAFVSAPASADWGDNRLRKPLSPGRSTGFDVSGGCVADLRVIYDNRSAEERRRIDICRNQAVTLEPGWTTSDELAPLDDATAGIRPDHRT